MQIRTLEDGMIAVFPFPADLGETLATKTADYMMDNVDAHGPSSEIWDLDRARKVFSEDGDVVFEDWKEGDKEIWDAVLSSAHAGEFKIVQPPAEGTDHYEALGGIAAEYQSEPNPLQALLERMIESMELEEDGDND